MQNDEEPEGTESEMCEMTPSFAIFMIARRLPFEIRLRIPFSKNFLLIGHHTVRTLRKRVEREPQAADLRITLAAELISHEPVTVENAEEAVREFRKALNLLPPIVEGEPGMRVRYAMVHKFLGDALLIAGDLSEARKHWKQTVELDPIRHPYSISSQALEQLQNHPLG
jgi:tetratricopeptide (TPR) repeat protein